MERLEDPNASSEEEPEAPLAPVPESDGHQNSASNNKEDMKATASSSSEPTNGNAGESSLVAANEKSENGETEADDREGEDEDAEDKIAEAPKVSKTQINQAFLAV